MSWLRAAWLLVALTLTSCATAPQVNEVWLNDDLRVQKIGHGVWLHTTWRQYGEWRVPSNGLLVGNGDGITMVDTAWGEEPTRELLNFVHEQLGTQVSLLIVTHGHDDRVSGAAAVKEAGGDVFFGVLTLRGELADLRSTSPHRIRQGMLLTEPGRSVRVAGTEVYYPGGAHTRDNLMVWLPQQRILFGGCAVRPAEANDLGNTADADIANWPYSIRRAAERYEDAQMVIPSHGEPGDIYLLQHTIDLALEQGDIGGL